MAIKFTNNSVKEQEPILTKYKYFLIRAAYYRGVVWAVNHHADTWEEMKVEKGFENLLTEFFTSGEDVTSLADDNGQK